MTSGSIVDVMAAGEHGFALTTTLGVDGLSPDRRVVTSRIPLRQNVSMTKVTMPTVQVRLGEPARWSSPDGKGGQVQYTVTVRPIPTR